MCRNTNLKLSELQEGDVLHTVNTKVLGYYENETYSNAFTIPASIKKSLVRKFVSFQQNSIPALRRSSFIGHQSIYTGVKDHRATIIEMDNRGVVECPVSEVTTYVVFRAKNSGYAQQIVEKARSTMLEGKKQYGLVEGLLGLRQVDDSEESENEARQQRGKYVCSGFVMDVLKKSCDTIPRELSPNPMDVAPARLYDIMNSCDDFECIGSVDFVGTENENFHPKELEAKLSQRFSRVDISDIMARVELMGEQLLQQDEPRSTGYDLWSYLSISLILRFFAAFMTGFVVSFSGFFLRLMCVVFLIPGFKYVRGFVLEECHLIFLHWVFFILSFTPMTHEVASAVSCILAWFLFFFSLHKMLTKPFLLNMCRLPQQCFSYGGLFWFLWNLIILLGLTLGFFSFPLTVSPFLQVVMFYELGYTLALAGEMLHLISN
jgi:hypothetical protein